MVVVLGVIGCSCCPSARSRACAIRLEALHPVALGAALAVVVAFVAATVPSQAVPPFIYFQF